MVNQKELLREEIKAIKEILAHQEQTEEAGMNRWTDKELKMIVQKEFLLKYQDKNEEELRTHLDRLQRDLSDLRSDQF